MILSDKQYQFIKWAVLTVLPALSVLISVLGKAYSFEYTDLTVLTINAVAVFLGAVTGVSQLNYNKNKEDQRLLVLFVLSKILGGITMTEKDLLKPTEVVDFDKDKYEQNVKDNTFDRNDEGKDGK